MTDYAENIIDCVENNRITFVRESNRIEGILRDPTQAEVDEMFRFMRLEEVTVAELARFVSVYQPNARLRDMPGLNVRVGDHIAPPGGPEIPEALTGILRDVPRQSPYDIHCRYETLHPFTDGNGRSGRVLWAWMMLRYDIWPGLRLGFLHAFYYQTLSAYRAPTPESLT